MMKNQSFIAFGFVYFSLAKRIGNHEIMPKVSAFQTFPLEFRYHPTMPGMKPGNVIRGMSASMGEGVVS